MMNYKFNTWIQSGEQAKEISSKGYDLLRAGNQSFTGQVIAHILYRHYIKGDSFHVINRENKSMPANIIKGILTGTYSPKTFNVFMDLAENETDTLESIYSDVKEEGENIG
ncbi:hypothetical protein [Halobacillus sp. B29]|uniref:hypothetical protein n=1 Tax=Halobacillus sp. B29 TaxID=3457432 RepID=UPI003FCD0542